MKNTHRLLLVGVVIIAIFLRGYHLTSAPPGLYPDEAMNGNNALETLATHHFKVFYPENNGREGLFIGIQALVLKLVGVREAWVLRLPSAVFGVLTVIGVYLLASRLFSIEVGLWASFFLATSFWHINFSRIGFRAIMAPLLLTWASYFFLRSIAATKKFTPLLWGGASGLVFGLGFYTYIAYRVAPLLFLLFIPFFRGKRTLWAATSSFLVATVLIGLPIGFYFLHNPADFFGRTTQVSIFSDAHPALEFGINVLKTLGMFVIAGDQNWRHNLAGRTQLFAPVAILLGIGIIAGVRSVGKGISVFPWVFIAAWFTLAALPVVVSNEGLPHALRSILIIVPVMIASGAGAQTTRVWLREHMTQRMVGIGTSALVAILIFQAFYSYFILFARNPNTANAFSANYVELGRNILNRADGHPIYVLVRANGVDVRGIPMPAQTVMFVTDTFRKENQEKLNIHYVLPSQEDSIPAGADVVVLE